jgi:hypothetical protein
MPDMNLLPFKTPRTRDEQRERITIPRVMRNEIPTTLVEVSPEKIAEITRWLQEKLQYMISVREEFVARKLIKYERTLAGERATIPSQQGASNVSVPLTMWAASGTRARLIQGTLSGNRIIIARPLKARTETGEPLADVAAALEKLITAEINNPRGLNGKQVIEKVCNQSVNTGTGAWKVYQELPVVRVEVLPDGSTVKRLDYGNVKWVDIPFRKLLWVDGFGTDAQAMPLVGHEYDKQWSEILLWEELGHYYEGTSQSIKTFYDNRKLGQGEDPKWLRSHRVAELYCDYVLYETGDLKNLVIPIVIDWHLEAQRVLRVALNTNPQGLRPLFIAPFDYPPDLSCGRGMGVSEKCEGAQDETDEVHNLCIEAAKRAVGHLIVLKAGSRAEEDLGGEDAILPGTVTVTENPAEDVLTVPLGDPKGVEVGLAVEANTLHYIFRILGYDESRLGDVGSAKRVPGGLGMAIMKEGRVNIAQALANIANGLNEAIYLTVELWRRNLPATSMTTALSQEEIDRLLGVVFSLDSEAVRSQFLITFNAQDAITVAESRKQELLVLNQFLMSFYDRLLNYLRFSATIPPQAQGIMQEILTKFSAAVRALVQTVDSIPSPDEVLPDVAAIMEQLTLLSAQLGAQGMGVGNMGNESGGRASQ